MLYHDCKSTTFFEIITFLERLFVSDYIFWNDFLSLITFFGTTF